MKIKLHLQDEKPLGLDRPLDLIAISNSDANTTNSRLVANEETTFGNVVVSLKSLGNKSYRIEWFSRMTGATTSIAKLSTGSYAVFRKWAVQKRLPDVSQEFASRKSALVHFLNNVDIFRANDVVLNSAKNYCLSLFSIQENLSIPKDHKFSRYRLQGAIGMKVQVRAKLNSDRVIAEGVLLQLVGTKAEVQITKYIDLVNKKPVQRFNSHLVFFN